MAGTRSSFDQSASWQKNLDNFVRGPTQPVSLAAHKRRLELLKEEKRRQEEAFLRGEREGPADSRIDAAVSKEEAQVSTGLGEQQRATIRRRQQSKLALGVADIPMRGIQSIFTQDNSLSRLPTPAGIGGLLLALLAFNILIFPVKGTHTRFDLLMHILLGGSDIQQPTAPGLIGKSSIDKALEVIAQSGESSNKDLQNIPILGGIYDVVTGQFGALSGSGGGSVLHPQSFTQSIHEATEEAIAGRNYGNTEF